MIRRWITLIVLFGCASLYAQNINLYLTLLEKGQMQEVKDNLPELLDRYPNEAGIYFLQAMVNNNGELSLIQFQTLALKFPNSEFASKSDNILNAVSKLSPERSTIFSAIRIESYLVLALYI